MQHHLVPKSGKVSEISFSEKFKEMEVTFHKGGKYKYKINPQVAKSLNIASERADKDNEYSFGKKFHELIVKQPQKYPYEKVAE